MWGRVRKIPKNCPTKQYLKGQNSKSIGDEHAAAFPYNSSAQCRGTFQEPPVVHRHPGTWNTGIKSSRWQKFRILPAVHLSLKSLKITTGSGLVVGSNSHYLHGEWFYVRLCMFVGTVSWCLSVYVFFSLKFGKANVVGVVSLCLVRVGLCWIEDLPYILAMGLLPDT